MSLSNILSFKSQPPTPNTLADYFGTAKIDFKLINPADYAHVVIDVQKQFCDPLYGRRGTIHTEEISRKIAHSMPLFRQFGIQTLVIYMGRPQDHIRVAAGGFHNIKTIKSDLVFKKEEKSPFSSPDFLPLLHDHGIKNMLVSGFNAGACVFDTVVDSLEQGFNVAVMKDLVGQDENRDDLIPVYLEQMQRRFGAYMTSSKEAYEFLGALTPHTHAV